MYFYQLYQSQLLYLLVAIVSLQKKMSMASTTQDILFHLFFAAQGALSLYGLVSLNDGDFYRF